MSMIDRRSDTAVSTGADMTGEHRRGHWYPWLFVGFFGLVFAVNAVMIGIALSTWTGLETRDHYRKGVAYNEVIDKQAAQQARGWQASLRCFRMAVQAAVTAARKEAEAEGAAKLAAALAKAKRDANAREEKAHQKATAEAEAAVKRATLQAQAHEAAALRASQREAAAHEQAAM